MNEINHQILCIFVGLQICPIISNSQPQTLICESRVILWPFSLEFCKDVTGKAAPVRAMNARAGMKV